MLITVVNEAPTQVENGELLAVIRAISRQIIYDFEPYWHLSARLRLAVNQGRLADPPSPVQMFLRNIKVDLGDHADGALMQMDPVAGGALIFLQTWKGRRPLYEKYSYCYGFHGMYGALPFPVGYVFVTEENGRDRDDWSLTLSHEILELIANPHVNLLVDAPYPGPKIEGEKKRRVLVEREVCDPVKDSSYLVDKVKVSNFVLPLYFLENGNANERVDFLGALDSEGRQLESFGMLEGGYVPFTDAGSGAKGVRARDFYGTYFDGEHPGKAAHLPYVRPITRDQGVAPVQKKVSKKNR